MRARSSPPAAAVTGVRPGRTMSQGLFELRKDAITGWWVATVIDRTFARERFALAGAARSTTAATASTAGIPAGDGIRLRTLKDFAFTVAGTEEEARAREGSVAQVTIADARAAGSWRTVVAPPGEHRPLHAVGHRHDRGAAAPAAGTRSASAAGANRTQHLQVVQNWGAQAGARTNHLCFDLYDLPQIPHRIAEELGGAARFLIREGECPYCRLVREEVRRPDHLLYADDHAVAFAPYASPLAVRGLGRAAPPRRGLRPRRRTATSPPPRRPCARSSAGSSASLDGPPYNLVLHTAPLREQVDATYHWHWEIHPRLREIAGLELGTGLPVNPVSPGGRGRRAAVRARRRTVRRSTRGDDRDGGRPSHGGDRRSSQRLGSAPLRWPGASSSVTHRSTRGRRSLRARTAAGPARRASR